MTLAPCWSSSLTVPSALERQPILSIRSEARRQVAGQSMNCSSCVHLLVTTGLFVEQWYDENAPLRSLMGPLKTPALGATVSSRLANYQEPAPTTGLG